MRQSDIIGGGNNYVDSYFELCFFFYMNRYRTPWSLVSPHQFFLFWIKIHSNPPPCNQENMRQFDCSRLAKKACYTDKCPVQFSIWPVDNSKKDLGRLSPFMVFGQHQVLVKNISVPSALAKEMSAASVSYIRMCQPFFLQRICQLTVLAVKC